MNITALEEYFKSATLQKEIQVNRSTRIAKVLKFVESHLLVLWQNGDRHAFRASHDRLIELEQIIENHYNF